MQVGPYRVLEEIARGGMGVVYRAQREGAGAPVALKVLLDFSSDLELLERFRREVRLLQGIEHPNLVRVLDVELDPPRPYAAFELVEGGTLQARVERDGPLPWEVAVRVVSEVAAGAAAAHERGLLHRDIKPDNVLLAPSGAKLADFGLVKDLDQDTLTQSGATLGTPAYLAPEQIGSEKERWGPATDVYGLAATLYFALTGRQPFLAPTTIATLIAVRESPPPSPRELAPNVPAWLDAACRRGMAKLGGDRYRDALTFRAALLHGGAAPGSPLRPRPALLAASALTLIGVAVLVAWRLGGEARLPVASSRVPGPSPVTLTAPEPALDPAQALLRAAEKKLAAGELEAALNDLDQAIQAAPDLPRAYLLRGSALELLQRVDEAESSYEKAIELDPESGAAYTSRGWLRSRRGDLDNAQLDFERALERGDASAEAHAGVADVALARGRPEDARAAALRAIERNPSLVEAHSILGRSLYHLERFEEAVAAWGRVLDLDPNDAKAHLFRALSWHGLERFDEALLDFGAAIAAEPKRAEAYFYRGLLRHTDRADLLGALNDMKLAREYTRSPKLRADALEHHRAIVKKLEQRLGPQRVASAEDLLTDGIQALEASRWAKARDLFNEAIRANPYRPRAYYLRGEAQRMLKQSPQAALADYDRALELDPSAHDVHRPRGAVLEQLGRHQEAAEALSRSLEHDPNDLAALLTRASVYRGLARPADALRDLERACALDPRNPMAHEIRGQALLALKRHDEAVGAFDRAIELDPGAAEAYTRRAIAHRHLGRSERAIRDYSKALELRPNDMRALAGRGIALLTMGRRAEALEDLEDFDRAMEQQAEPAAGGSRVNGEWAAAHEILFAAGKTAIGEERYDEAVGLLDRALRIDPRRARAYLQRGEALRLLGRPAAALADYDRALEVSPNDAIVHARRGEVLNRLGRRLEAAQAYGRAIELNPGGASARLARGRLLLEAGQYESALDDYQRACELEPNSAIAHNGRGEALRYLGRYEEALLSSTRAAELYPDSAFVRFGLGLTRYGLDDHEGAVQAYTRALELKPRNPAQILQARGQAQEARGRYAEAIVDYDRALELGLDPDGEDLVGRLRARAAARLEAE